MTARRGLAEGGPDLRAGLAALGYGVLVVGLLAVAAGTLADLAERRAEVATADDLLTRLQGRRVPAADADATWSGSPFVEGPTVTVAGANLMQRIADAVSRFEGRIMSSRVELQGAPLGPGFIGVTANFEIGQDDLQRLLYDLEAGLPFLFLDQVAIQAVDRADAGAVRLTVLLTAYGQWEGGR